MPLLNVLADRCRVVGRRALLAGGALGQRCLKSALGLYVLWRNQFVLTLARSNASCTVAPFNDNSPNLHGSLPRPKVWLLFHNPKFGIRVRCFRLTLLRNVRDVSEARYHRSKGRAQGALARFRYIR